MKAYLDIIKREIIKPRKPLRNLLHLIYGFKNSIRNKNKNSKNALLVWDIRSNPITFDFIFTIFYVYSSLKKRRNKSCFNLVIYYPDKFILKPFSFKNYNSFVSAEELHSRIDNIISPLANSFSCIKKVFLINKKEDLFKIINNHKFVFPRNYNPNYFLIQPLDYLTAYKYLKDSNNLSIPDLIPENKIRNSFNMNNQLTNSEYITFTLRDYGFSPSRNTDSKDLKKIAKVAEILNCKLVIIPDDINRLKYYPISPETIISKEARNDLNTRIFLYSNSKLNIFKPSGPSNVSLFCKKAKTIILNFCEGGFDSNEKYYKNIYDIKVGDQPYKKLNGFIMWNQIYQNYTSEDVLNAYKNLCTQNY